MLKRHLYWIVLGTIVAGCAAMFITPHSGVGALIVTATTVELFYLVVMGGPEDAAAKFWSGLLGLVWLACFLGFAWDARASLHTRAPQSNAILSAYSTFLDKAYMPLARLVDVGGPIRRYDPMTGRAKEERSIIEFQCLLDADTKTYSERPIPSKANFSRFLASLSAWIVAASTAAVISRRKQKAALGDIA